MDSKKEFVDRAVHNAQDQFSARLDKARAEAKALVASVPGINVTFPEEGEIQKRMKDLEKWHAEVAANQFDYFLDKSVDLIGKLKEYGVDTTAMRATVLARAMGELGWWEDD